MTSREIFVTMGNRLSGSKDEEHESNFMSPENLPLVNNPVELDCEKIKRDTGEFTSLSKEDNLFIKKGNLSQNDKMHTIDLTDVDIDLTDADIDLTDVDIDLTDVETETHENIKANISNGVSSYVVDGNREVSTENVDNKLCHDTILNFCMTEKGNELISVDLTASNGETSDTGYKELSILLKSPQKSPIKNSNNCDTFEMDFAITPDENGRNFIKPLDKEVISNKQNIMYNNSEKCNQNSIIILRNLMENSTKGKGIKKKHTNKNVDNTQLGTEKLQNVKVCNGSNSIISGSNSIINSDERVHTISNEERPCFKMLPESVNLAQIENESNSNFILHDRETSCQELRILDGSSQTGERKSIQLGIKYDKTVHDDADISIVYDSKNCNAPEVILTSDNDSNNEKNPNPCKKFYKEIDKELGILQTKHLDMERNLSAAATIISNDAVHIPISKMKGELTSFKVSLEKLKERFKNKWLHAESEISNEQSKPSCSYQQYSEGTNKTQMHSEEYTVLRKESHTLYNDRELHDSYEHALQLSTQKKDEVSDKYRQKSKRLSFKMETYREMDKKKLSDYDDEHDFNLFPEEKIQNCPKNLLKNYTCFKKKIVGSRSVRETKFCSYVNKQDYALTRHVSKTYVDEKELAVKLDSRKYTSHKSLLSRSSTSLSSTDENNHLSPVICTRKKKSTKQCKKVCKLPKYDTEQDFSSDTSDFSQISSTTDTELTPTYLDSKHNRNHRTHLKKILRNLNSAKKDKLSSGKKKIGGSKYEKGTFHMNSSDSDSCHSSEETDTCSRKSCKNPTEKIRICNLITRQLKTINEHVSRKDDLMKSVKDSSNVSNIIKKYKEDDLEEANFEGGINVALTPEYSKRKNTSELHTRSYKLAKEDNFVDVHNRLRKKHKIQNYCEKLQSSDITHEQMKQQMRQQNEKEKNDFDQKKFEIESYRAKLRSSDVMPSSSTFVSSVEESRRNKKEMNYSRLGTFKVRHQMEEESEKEFNNFDNKVMAIHNDVAEANENHEKENTTIKDMEAFLLSLKMKKLENASHDEKFFNIIQKHKFKVSDVNKINPKNTLMQESQKIITDFGNSKIASDKLKSIGCCNNPNKISLGETEQRWTGKKMMKQNIGDESRSFSVYNNPNKIPLGETEQRWAGKKMMKQNIGEESRSLTVYNNPNKIPLGETEQRSAEKKMMKQNIGDESRSFSVYNNPNKIPLGETEQRWAGKKMMKQNIGDESRSFIVYNNPNKIPLGETEQRWAGKKMMKQNIGDESRSFSVYNHPNKIPLGETEQRLAGKKMMKQNIGDESRSLTVYNNSLDLFKQLNREIQKKK